MYISSFTPDPAESADALADVSEECPGCTCCARAACKLPGDVPCFRPQGGTLPEWWECPCAILHEDTESSDDTGYVVVFDPINESNPRIAFGSLTHLLSAKVARSLADHKNNVSHQFGNPGHYSVREVHIVITPVADAR